MSFLQKSTSDFSRKLQESRLWDISTRQARIIRFHHSNLFVLLVRKTEFRLLNSLFQILRKFVRLHRLSLIELTGFTLQRTIQFSVHCLLWYRFSTMLKSRFSLVTLLVQRTADALWLLDSIITKQDMQLVK